MVDLQSITAEDWAADLAGFLGVALILAPVAALPLLLPPAAFFSPAAPPGVFFFLLETVAAEAAVALLLFGVTAASPGSTDFLLRDVDGCKRGKHCYKSAELVIETNNASYEKCERKMEMGKSNHFLPHKTDIDSMKKN